MGYSRTYCSDPNRGCWHGLVAVTIGAVLTLGVFTYSSKPYIYGAAIWALLCGYATTTGTRPWVKAAWLNLGVLLLTLGMAEIYFDRVYFAEEPPSEERFSDDDNLFREHDLLGFAPAKDRSYTHVRWYGHEVIYRVTYTIDGHGLRIAPPFRIVPGNDPPCLLFFGDSFTFGEGVNDEETLPYRVGRKSQGRYQTVNFAFLGYGPHQMLAQLQQGLVDAAIHCRPVYAIYQALPDHVSRAAGLEVWDQHGPKFVLEQDGAVEWKGPFDEEKPFRLHDVFRRFHTERVPAKVAQQLERSALYKGLLYMHRPIDDNDIDLFVGIVDATRRIIEARYPGAQFHVLFWDFTGPDTGETRIIEGLNAKRLSLHRISAILPDYRAHPERFWIHSVDRHPNPLAHERLADYVLTTLVNPAAHGLPSREDSMTPEGASLMIPVRDAKRSGIERLLRNCRCSVVATP